MTERKKELAAELEGLDPAKQFYLGISVGNIDGSVEFKAEPIEGASHDSESVIEICRELTVGYGLECFVYRCVPILRISRGKVRVQKLP